MDGNVKKWLKEPLGSHLKQDEKTKVPKLPLCDFCRNGTLARFDGSTIFGTWAYMCPKHMKRFGKGLGLGMGQMLIREKP